MDHVNTCFVTAVASETQHVHQKLLQAYEQAIPTAAETGLPALAVESANSAVAKFGKKQLHHQDAPAGSWKRKYTLTYMYTDKDCAEVGKYAAENSVARAQKHFPDLDLGESMVRYFRNKYLVEVVQRTKNGDTTKVTKLPCGQRGRKVALDEKLDTEIKQYIQCVRANGTPISKVLVQAAAEGYLINRDRTVFVGYGGHVSLTADWARLLLHRMGYVKRKGITKANTKLPEEGFQQMKASFLQQTVAVVTAHNIPPELIINLDETGVELVPVGKWTMASEGSKRVEVMGLDDKR